MLVAYVLKRSQLAFFAALERGEVRAVCAETHGNDDSTKGGFGWRHARFDLHRDR
jgi:hypothetical protein